MESLYTHGRPTKLERAFGITPSLGIHEGEGGMSECRSLLIVLHMTYNTHVIYSCNCCWNELLRKLKYDATVLACWYGI